MKKVGEVLLDSGVLVLGDLIHVQKIKPSVHSTPRVFQDTKTETKYIQNTDFQKFTDILFEEKSINELLKEGRLEEIFPTSNQELSSSMILQGLEKGFNQVDFENGEKGKAFAVLLPEGTFQVLAQVGENGIEKITLDFT